MIWFPQAPTPRFRGPALPGWLAVAAALVAPAVSVNRPAVPVFAAEGPPAAPIYQPDPLPPALGSELLGKNFKRDPRSGNYLAPKVFARTPEERLVPVFIDGKYVKGLGGRTVFVRESIRDRLLAADSAMFAQKREHIAINYGFRSNALQGELYQRLHGKSQVAPAGGSFHETGMALDIHNWRSAQRFMIEAGFVGGCYGIEEDLVHYSVGEISKASNTEAFKRCTLKEIPEQIVKGMKKVSDTDGLKKVGSAGGKGIKKIGGMFGRLKKD